MRLEPWLLEVWYGNRNSGRWLQPAAWLYRVLAGIRARRGRRASCRMRLPVVVVGNITAGGTGKTPLVLWLARTTRAAGYRPGILCRGYRGTGPWPCVVTPDSDPGTVGDEALMLARRATGPVVAGPDRCAAGKLLADQHIDLIISDDGLQHYRLQRDLEIAVIDGQRLLGNERYIPAGPLREAPARLETVDFVVINGATAPRWPDALTMQIDGQTLRSLTDTTSRGLDEFAGQKVHAVAGTGNPDRFFDLLRRHGLLPLEHRFADHVSFTGKDLQFADELPIIMTEKDAVKCLAFAMPHMWMLPVEARFDAAAEVRLRDSLKQLVLATAS